ncbi:Phosphotransferase enzyme [Ceratobasidium sp. 414]|nr:Phosphotransferase enzyme [Ceratobasidium sp. 414]
MFRTLFKTSRLVQQTSSLRCARTISTHEAFSYTSGRWIIDEPARLAERYQPFNIEALKTATATVGQATSVVKMSKFGVEGAYSKTFLMTLNTGRELIARIPNPLYGPTHPILTSEVATMEYARDRLGAPIPRVLDWCADKNSTPVQAAYMVTEKPPGVILEDVWHTFDIDRKLQVAKQIASIEQALDQGVFPAFGSLYRRADLKKDELYVDIPGDDTYVVGCSAELSWWKGRRDHLDIIRGPWATTQEYLLGPVLREYKWLLKFAQSSVRPRWVLITRQEAERHPKELLDMLKLYGSVVPQLLPAAETYVTAHSPTLRHPNLDLYNIFVSITDEQVKVTSLTDWSHSWLGPRYLYHWVPEFIRLPELPAGAERTTDLPPDFAELSDEDQARTRAEADITKCRLAYEELRKVHDPTLADLYDNFLCYRLRGMVAWSGDIWHNGYLPMRRSMVDIQAIWPKLLPDTPCPIQYSPEERAMIISEALAWQERQDLIAELEILFHATREGLVFTHNYEACKELVSLTWEKMATDDDPGAQSLREIWPWERS